MKHEIQNNIGFPHCFVCCDGTMQNFGVLEFFFFLQINGNMGKCFIFSVDQEILLSIRNNSFIYSANIHRVSLCQALF